MAGKWFGGLTNIHCMYMFSHKFNTPIYTLFTQLSVKTTGPGLMTWGCGLRRYVMSEFRSEWGVRVVLRYVMELQHLRPTCHVLRS